jgi:hypothetical protein
MQVSDMITKIVGTNVTDINNTPSDIGVSTLVRIYSANIAVITQTTAAAGAIGNITVPAGSVTFITKAYTDLLSSDVAVICTPVAYQVG